MKTRHIIFLILLVASFTILMTACQKEKEQQPESTEAVFLPTRSAATVPVPTKAAACTNVMGFVEDVTYEDGAGVAPGTKFLEEWEVINYSDCAWGEGYHLFFVSGNQMGAPDYVEIPHIPIGARGKISIELTAPEEKGEYRSEWKLFGADNRFFGESLIANIIVE